MKSRLYVFITALSFIAFLSGCSVQKMSHPHSYVEKLGDDTLSVETFSRDARGYEGQLMQRMPATQVASYKADLNNKGMVTHMKITWKTPDDNPKGPKPRTWEVTIKNNVATIHMSGVWRGKQIDTTFTKNVPAGTIPAVGKYPPAVSTFSQVMHQADKNGDGSEYSTSVLYAGWNRLIPTKIHHVSEDTLSMKEMDGFWYTATVNKQGVINWYSAKNTTVRTITNLENNIHISELASMFAKRDAEGRGMPIASPLDSSKITIDGAHLKVVYSRPSVRGRKIWGGLVPYNKEWRTGANAATMFYTSKKLEIGKIMVPAGIYTLYSIYTPDSAKLIINSQTGQWGTVYHESRDFARIPMEKKELAKTQEKFLISFKPSGKGGYIILSWNKTEYRVPFKVR